MLVADFESADHCLLLGRGVHVLVYSHFEKGALTGLGIHKDVVDLGQGHLPTDCVQLDHYCEAVLAEDYFTEVQANS